MLDVQSIRKDFPILDHKIYDKPLIYFDNGATTQKPRPVVEKIESGYYNVNANIHRGVHFLSQPDCFQLYRRMYVGRRRSDRFGDGASFQYRSLADTGCP